MGPAPTNTRFHSFRISPSGALRRSVYGRAFQVMQFLPKPRSAVSPAHSVRPSVRPSGSVFRSAPLWSAHLGLSAQPQSVSSFFNVCAGLADPPPPHSVGPAPSPSQTRAALHVPPPAYTDLVLSLDSLPATRDGTYRHSQPICYGTRGLGQ